MRTHRDKYETVFRLSLKLKATNPKIENRITHLRRGYLSRETHHNQLSPEAKRIMPGR
jgi:hypothetical protein